MDVSVIIPSYNERESLPELIAWIDRVMQEHSFSYEILVIDDGSTDGSWTEIQALSEKYPALHGLSFRRNYGKSAALFADLRGLRVRSSSLWTQTFRTLLTRSPRCTG